MQADHIDKRRAQRIDSLQALRGWAFLGVFFEHAKFFIRWPALAVSIFFVMSGFLMSYRYEGVELDASPRGCFRFAWKKIRKLYPLHIITMLCAALLPAARILYNRTGLTPALKLLGMMALHSTLLETWVPNCTVATALNGVSWYLSVTLFLYFLYPWLKKLVEHWPLVRLCVLAVLLLPLETLVCMPVLRIWGARSAVYLWFMYCFPLFRVGDFFIGCVLKRVFLECDVKRMGTAAATALEGGATAFTALMYIWCSHGHANLVLDAFNNWTTPFIPMAAMWVMLFAAKRGLLTRLLSCPAAIRIGNISAFAYLIHNIVTMYTQYLLAKLNLEPGGWVLAAVILAEFAVSLALSVCYKRLDGKVFSGRTLTKAAG